VIAAGMERISVEIGGTPRPGPALFIRGLQSHYVADADWPQIQRLFPQAQLLDFPEAGHWVHAEAPEAFYRAIMDFLP
jgi:pimeloyl-ACP methyl ester carboxylesterase